jgi:hypothetical protein
MSTAWTCVEFLALFAAVFCAAYALRVVFVPDAVAIADREQPTWQVEAAFVLDALENLGLAGAAITILLALGVSQRQLLRPLPRP